MSTEKDNKRILEDMSTKDAIFKCGELQLPIEQVATLLSDKTNPITLYDDLSTPGTDAYDWYNQGVAEGNLKLNINLEYNIGDPKAKDAYKHLSAERRRQVINKKLDDLFGL